jgi:probable phosphoglycerate mutase
MVPSFPDADGCTLYLVRHGDSRQDQVKRYIGQTDLPLNDVGRAQIKSLHRRLVKIDFARIYSSDLGRCLETARLIAGPLGKIIRTLPAFREIDLGEWDGQPVAGIREAFPEEYECRGRELVDFRPPGGESFRDLQSRVIPAFNEIIGQTCGTMLLVAHAGVNRTILCHILDLPLGELFQVPQDFGCLNIIERAGNRLTVKTINQLGGQS